MDIVSFLLDVLKTAFGFIVGTIISAVITGLLVNKFVVKRIVNNRDIQDIVRLVKDAKDALIEHNNAGKNCEGENG